MILHQHLQVSSRHGYSLIGEIHIPKGDGPFPAIIFLHGYRSSKESKKMVMLMEQVQDDYACVRFDASGHGQSGGIFEDITPTRYAEDGEDVLAFLQKKNIPKLDLTKLAIYGSSLGGFVAGMIAAKHPEVKALMLFAPVSDFAFQKAECEKARKKGLSSIQLPFRRYGHIEIQCALAEDGARYDFYRLSKNTYCPTIIFHGDQDEVIPLSQSKKLEKSLPHAELRIIEGADHVFNDDAALFKKMSEECREFLKRHLNVPKSKEEK